MKFIFLNANIYSNYKKLIFFFIAGIILFISSLSVFSCQKSTDKLHFAKHGILDIRNWNPGEGELLNLDGEWEFYWKEILYYNDFVSGKAHPPKFYFNIPGFWNGYSWNGNELAGDGFATFHLKILLPESNEFPLALRVKKSFTSYELYVNGQKIASNGKVGKTKEEVIPEWFPVTSDSLFAQNGILDIIIHSSNYHHKKGGLKFPVTLGSKKAILEKKEMNVSFESFLIGSGIIMGIYHLFLYLQRRQEKSALFFGLFCFLLSVRTSINGESYFLKIFTDIPFEHLMRITYIDLYLLTPIFIQYIYFVFPENFNKNYLRYLWIAQFLLITIVIFFPIKYFVSTLNIFFIFLFIIIIYSIFPLIKILKYKKEGSVFFTLGLLFFYSTIINDILYNLSITEFGYMLPVGLFVFIFTQSIILSLRFANAFIRIEELSETLSVQNIKLQNLDKLKDEFIANTSHELRTPLNGIIGIAESLNDGITGPLNVETKNNLSVLISSGKRLSSLINDMLDFCKLKTDELKLKKKPINIKDITDIVIFLCKPLIAEKNISIINEIPNDSPPVLADEDRIQQVLHNLISNAIKFTDNGEIRILLKIVMHSNREVAQMTISDTGIGIPPERQDLIFNSFEFGDKIVEREYGGVGIGLTITKKLIELHGGKIWVESQVNNGSKFHFTLPVSVLEYSNGANAKLENKLIKKFDNGHERNSEDVKFSLPIYPKYNPSAPKALVVDDEPINLQVIKHQLQLSGFAVEVAISGYEALAKLQIQAPDIILLDIKMPKMNGFELAKIIRKEYSIEVLPIIFLTALNHENDILKAFEIGANDYIIKPFSRQELLARIDSHIKIKKINEEYVKLNESLEKLVIERTAELEKKNEKLIELNKEKNEFLGIAAHDLKSPLAGIKLVAEVLSNNSNMSSEFQKMFELIHHSTIQMFGIISNLLDVNKIDSGEIETYLEVISFKAIVLEVLEPYIDLAEKKKIKIHIELPDSDSNIFADRILLNEILDNLISNAVKFTPLERIIYIRIKETSKSYVLEVANEGQGISKDEQKKLFTKFPRLSTKPTGKEHSTGLGLYIVKKLTEKINGVIKYKGDEGKGSSFFLELKKAK